MKRSRPCSMSSSPSNAVTNQLSPNWSTSVASIASAVSVRSAPPRREFRYDAIAEVRDATRAHPVPHRVEHRDVRDVAVDGVVERVTRDLVRRLEHAGDAHTWRPERERRQQRPPELGREVHRLEPARELVAVRVVPLADDEPRSDRCEELHVFDQRDARVVDDRAQHTEAVLAVDEWDVDPLGARLPRRPRAPGGAGTYHRRASLRPRAGPRTSGC